MTRELPTGTVTLMFTDIEGSTRLLQTLGAAYAATLCEHRRLLREVFHVHGGVEIGTEGDSFFVAFPNAVDAVDAALEAQHALADGPVRVRMGLHTGHPSVVDGGYVGMDVHRAARIAACGHGGQVLLSQSTRSLVDVAVTDLGLHWLKDLPAAEHLYQLGAGEFPPLKSLNPSNLPADARRFLGRERELAAVAALLSQAETRIVTLSGPGGSGKTRLALQAARQAVPSYLDGVWFVELGAITDPSLMPAAIAATLGVRETSTETYEQALIHHVGHKQLLLVLDNLEQLLPDAADMIARLVAAAPEVDVLATSRESLRLSGESELAVDPMPLDEAVELFVERTRLTRPGFVLDSDARVVVEAICERVDRLPLAIELAAARTRVLSLPALLERLQDRLGLLVGGPRDLPARQQTLRETIAWSHDLLDLPVRSLMARLAVFAGGCTLEAAETVAGGDLDSIATLLDHNLLTRRDLPTGEVRASMLETIREFAAEQLEASEDADATRLAHARFFTELAERLGADLVGGRQSTALELFEADHDNLRAAMQFALEHGPAELGLRIAAASWMFWFTHGYISEGRQWLNATLAATPDDPTEARATALDGAGFLAAEQDEREISTDLLRQAVDCAERAGARRARALALSHLSARLPPEEGRVLAEQAVSLVRDAGDPFVLAIALNNLGEALRVLGETQAAIATHRQSYEIRRRHGDLMGASLSLINLGEMALATGDVAAATAALGEALELSRSVANTRHVCFSLADLGWAALAEGRPEEAERYLLESLALASDLGMRYYALDIVQALAGTSAARGDADRAARLSGAADALLVPLPRLPAMMDSGIHLSSLAEARRGADPAAWSRAVGEAAQWTLEETVEFALRH